MNERWLTMASGALVWLVLGASGGWTMCEAAAAGAESAAAGSFAAYRQQALAGHEAKFDAIRAAHAADGAMKGFCARLALVDEVAGLMVSRFDAVKAASMKVLLEDVSGPKKVELKKGQVRKATPAVSGMNAVEILAEYQDRFSAALPVPTVKEDELAALRAYYDGAARAAGRFIAERGRFIEAVDKQQTVDVLELCAVVPFLHVDDLSWTKDDIAAFPDWMKTSEHLKVLETFALRVRRPGTAYQFALFAATASSVSSAPMTYAAYLVGAAERLLKGGEYYAGIHCLKTGLVQAEERQEEAAAETLYFQLAEIMGKISHPQLAAEELKTFMSRHPEAALWSKAAMLRLKYLYEAGDMAKAIEEAGRYRAEPRCGPYLPQILYIDWVAQRRENQADEAEKTQKEFLARFPQHPLGADLHFASAMNALAAGNYDEALRLLEIIQYRYPNSRLQDKVKQIQERLSKVSAPSGSQAGSKTGSK